MAEERDSQQKLTVYSAMSNPQTDLEIKMNEVNHIFYRLTVYMAIDFVLSNLLNTHECNLYNDKEFDYILLIIKCSAITVILLIFFLLLLIYSPFITLIIKKTYILYSLLYFFYKLFLHIKSFVSDFNGISAIDLLFFFVALITIIPRVVFYYYIDLFAERLTQMVEIRKCEDHDKFVENLGDRMDRGQNTKWSENSMSYDRTNNKDIDINESKDKEKGMERQSEFKLVTINTEKTESMDNNFKVEEDHFIKEQEN